MNSKRALSQGMAKMGDTRSQLFSLFSGKEVGPDLRWAFRKHCSDHCNIESAY